MTTIASTGDGLALRRVVSAVPTVMAAGLAALVVVWRAITLALPLYRDPGLFTWVGNVMVSGGMPYRDAWDIKGPVAHAGYALALALFGPHDFAVRLFDLIIWSLSLVAAWRLAVRYGGSELGFLVLPMMALMPCDAWRLGQPDVWAGLAAITMLTLVTSPGAGLRQYVAAGALVGVTMLIKPNYALFGAAIVAAAYSSTADRKAAAQLVLAGVFGTVAVIGLTLAIFAAKGALGDMIDALVVFNLRVHVGRRSVPAMQIITHVLYDLFGPQHLLRTLVAIVGLWLMWTKKGAAQTAPLVAALMAAYVAGASQLKWFTYHFTAYDILFVIPCAYALIAAVAYVRTAEFGASLRQAVVLFALAAIGCLGVLANSVNEALAISRIEWSRALGLTTTAEADSHHCYDDFCRPAINDAARFIRQATKPGDGIYLWGFDALLYVEAGRPSVSRYGFNYPMVVGDPALIKAARAELMDELAQRPPAAIAVQEGEEKSIYSIYPQSSRAYLDTFGELKALIASGYTEAYRNSHFTVYLKNAN